MEPLATAGEFAGLVFRLAEGAWTLSALRSALETGMLDDLSGEPVTTAALARATSLPEPFVESVLAVVAAAGVVGASAEGWRASPGLLASLAATGKDYLVADLLSHQRQSADVVRLGRATPGQPAGWDHLDPEILEAQGIRSSPLPVGWAQRLFPTLDDLPARLAAPGARALDVGTGVGRLAISLCRQYPEVTVVGIDPYEVPLGLARTNVETAGMTARIELRQQRVEDLADEAAFDLAWVPTFFLTPDALGIAAVTVGRALRPGAWAIFGCLAPDVAPNVLAVLRLNALAWGSEAYHPDVVRGHLEPLGYKDFRLPPTPPAIPVQMVAARKPAP